MKVCSPQRPPPRSSPASGGRRLRFEVRSSNCEVRNLFIRARTSNLNPPSPNVAPPPSAACEEEISSFELEPRTSHLNPPSLNVAAPLSSACEGKGLLHSNSNLEPRTSILNPQSSILPPDRQGACPPDCSTCHTLCAPHAASRGPWSFSHLQPETTQFSTPSRPPLAFRPFSPRLRLLFPSDFFRKG
jgi:hypothetical protein